MTNPNRQRSHSKYSTESGTSLMINKANLTQIERKSTLLFCFLCEYLRKHDTNRE